jgi:hypothetical protein
MYSSLKLDFIAVCFLTGKDRGKRAEEGWEGGRKERKSQACLLAHTCIPGYSGNTD